jgi:hypothetical protein
MAAINYQFAPTSDAALFDAEMPSTFLKIHSYSLKRQLIPGWILRKSDIAKSLNLSISTVKRALRWLRDHGYAAYNRVTNWKMFPAPQATPHNGLDTIGGGSFLTPETMQEGVTFEPPIEKEIFKETKQQHEPEPIPENSVVVFSGESLQDTDQEPMPIPDVDPIPEPTPLHDPEPIPAPEPVKEPVVVSLENEEAAPLVFPPKLSEPQRKAAKNKIKEAPLDMRQAILIVLAANMAKGTVKNPIGYLNKLITASKNGTFEPIDSSGGAIKENPNITKTAAKLSAHRDIKPSEPEVRRGFMSGIHAALRGIAT